MKKLALALVALTLSLPAVAQTAQQPRPKFGLGVAIVPLQPYTAFPTIEVYAPLTVAPNFRIEPSLGIFTNDQPVGQTDTRDVTVGVGAFLLKRLAPQSDIYLGGRLKLNFAKADFGVTEDSGTDLVLAGAVGGEYYLVPRFSLGLEAQLGFYQNSNVSGDDSGFFTNGLAFVRAYL